MAMVGVDNSSLQADSRTKTNDVVRRSAASCGCSVGLHSSDERSELSEWICRHVSAACKSDVHSGRHKVRSFVRSFTHSFVHSFIHSFVEKGTNRHTNIQTEMLNKNTHPHKLHISKTKNNIHYCVGAATPSTTDS